MSNYQQLCWILMTITAIIVCSVTGSNTNDSNARGLVDTTRRGSFNGNPLDHPPIIVEFHADQNTDDQNNENIYLHKNHNMKMKCSAIGLQPIKYTWFLNDTVITNTSMLYVQNKSVIWVTEDGVLFISGTDDQTYTGIYHCIASNDIGQARSRDIHAHIAVFERGYNGIQIRRQVSNCPFVLNCSYDLVKFSWPWPSIYSWEDQNSTPLTVDRNRIITKEGALVFSYFRDTDPSNVICTAENTVIKERYKLGYKLNYIIEIQGHRTECQTESNSSMVYKSTDQTVLEGRKVWLHCLFHKSSDGSMKWAKDGEDRPGENSPTFEINNTASSDAGSYQCSKGNSSHVIQVIVDASATIKEVWNTTNNRLRVGDTAEFSCSFSGRPTPNITWLIDGVPITTKFSNPAQYNVSGSTYRSDLVLINVTYNASVICKASNKYGSQLNGSFVMASDVFESPEQLTTEVTTTETTDDLKYLATSTQNQQEHRHYAVNGPPIEGPNDVANHLILAVALSVSASIIVTFVMVLVICFVLRKRHAITMAVEVQDQEQPPGFVHHRQHEYEHEEIPMTSLQHERGQEEIPLTSLQSSDS